MAAQIKLFQQLVWLVDTIYSAGRISRPEIDRRWLQSSYNENHEEEYGERNFHRHRKAISELFGIEIICNRTTDEYMIAGKNDLEEDGMRAWLVDTFAVNNVVNLAGDMRERIIFERIPEGTRYLSTIVGAMKKGHKLQVTYRRFGQEPHTFLAAPYCLKVFKQRWYLVAKSDDHSDEKYPRVYALDRVQSIEETAHKFRMPKSFSPDKFFAAQFGVDRSLTKAEVVRVKVSASAANYIRSLPIHATQMELERNADHSVFRFHLAPTYDFIQELRKHGSYLEVLSPEWLRSRFREESRALSSLYSD